MNFVSEVDALKSARNQKEDKDFLIYCCWIYRQDSLFDLKQRLSCFW